MSTTKKGRTRRLHSSSSVFDDMVTREKTASRDLNLGWEYVIQRSISPHDGVTANARRIKDSFFFEQSMLNCDSKMKDSRLTMRPQSACQGFGRVLMRQVGGGLSGGTVIGTGMRNDGLPSLMEDRRARFSYQKKGNHQ